jgi:hypothetical protein
MGPQPVDVRGHRRTFSPPAAASADPHIMRVSTIAGAHQQPVSPFAIVGPIVDGIWRGATSSVWTMAAFLVLLVLAVVRVVHGVLYPSNVRDPVRRFSRAQRSLILARAGGRCEHHGLLTKRCRETQKLEADHIHPHSRGGQTHVDNGQALCRAHNRSKRAAIPFNWQLRTLERQRASYYPPGQLSAVVRLAPRTRSRSARSNGRQ